MVQLVAIKTSWAAGSLLGFLMAAQQTAGQTSDRTFVFTVDLLEGATGYFRVEGYDGVQPELTMVR